jgi:hypothetical protein
LISVERAQLTRLVFMRTGSRPKVKDHVQISRLVTRAPKDDNRLMALAKLSSHATRQHPGLSPMQAEEGPN